MTSSESVDRRRLFEARDMVLGGLFGALAIVLPIAFHAVQLGKAFLPMYLPVLALGMLVAWEVAASVGVMAPLLSAALTGMPPAPLAPIMAVELGVLGLSASLCRGWRVPVPLVPVLAIITTRAVGSVAVLLIAPLTGFKQGVYAYLVGSVVGSIPGLVLLLTVVPAAVYVIEQTSILGRASRSSQRGGAR
ncbi:MAG: ECF transporter S component [Candidatus Zipacnadales bacterium]